VGHRPEWRRCSSAQQRICLVVRRGRSE
jgi:hypothetical protein